MNALHLWTAVCLVSGGLAAVLGLNPHHYMRAMTRHRLRPEMYFVLLLFLALVSFLSLIMAGLSR